MSDETPASINRMLCTTLVDGVAPASPQLLESLELPDQLFVLAGTVLSLSSDASLGIADMEAALAYSTPLPSRIPDYGLYVVARGSHVSCTLVDRRRQIIVTHSLTGALTGQRSWNSFQCAVEDTLDVAKRTREQGVVFDFVVNRQSAIRILRP